MHTVLLPTGRRAYARHTRAKSHEGTRLWAAYIMSGIAVVYMVFDGVSKLLSISRSVAGMAHLGYPERLTPLIGVLLLVCLTFYVVPPTAVFGAILLTGYLGGAVASSLRIESPLLSTTLLPVYTAGLIWGGLYLRDPHLRGLIPFRQAGPR